MNSEEKLVQGLKLVVEAFTEMINLNLSGQAVQSKHSPLKDNVDKTFKIKEAADYLQIAHSMLYTLARAGKVKHFRSGAKYLFRKSALDEWVEQELNNSIKKDEPEENQYGKLRKVKA